MKTGHVLIVGNEKGGAGKSTMAVHIAVAAARCGLRVAALDLDRRQRTFERYFENRARWAAQNGADLSKPAFSFLTQAVASDRVGAEREEKLATEDLIAQMSAKNDLVIVDAPGADTPASRAAHSCADTLITPLNDSFIDFDLLAEIDPETGAIGKPSVYAEMVWEARKVKAARDRRPIDWILVRNRLSPLDAKNKRRVGDALTALAGRIGFRVAPGLSERVIYREMFSVGLTLLDLTDEGAESTFTMSHVAARQELREILMALRLPMLNGKALGF